MPASKIGLSLSLSLPQQQLSVVIATAAATTTRVTVVSRNERQLSGRMSIVLVGRRATILTRVWTELSAGHFGQRPIVPK